MTAAMTPEQARAHLEGLRSRFRSRTATSADHRPALEAVLALGEPEAGQWLIEITDGFSYVYSAERAERQRREASGPYYPVESPGDRPPSR